MSENSSTAHGPRFQFSLRTLLELVLAFAVALTLWRMIARARLNAEIARLEQLCGPFDIQPGNEDSIHAAMFPSTTELNWQWRVRIPPGKKGAMWYYHGPPLPEGQFPSNAKKQDLATGGSTPPGIDPSDPVEAIVSIKLIQIDSRYADWKLKLDDAGRQPLSCRAMIGISCEPGTVRWLADSSRPGISHNVTTQQACAPVKKGSPVQLFGFNPDPGKTGKYTNEKIRKSPKDRAQSAESTDYATALYADKAEPWVMQIWLTEE
jgi:hypothetical protein